MNTEFIPSCAEDFNLFIEGNGLREYSMGGRKFTRVGEGGKLSKIDRFLVCGQFWNQWPNAAVTALPRVISDHSPLTLSTASLNFGPTPFRLYNSCIGKPGVDELVLSVANDDHYRGSADVIFASKLKAIKVKLKEWLNENRDSRLITKQETSMKISALDQLMEERALHPIELREWAEWPCDKGGLGLGSLKDLNDGLLAKWWWRYKTEKGSIWRKVIDAIHLNQNSWSYLPVKKGIPGSWNMITKLDKEFSMRNLTLKSLIKGSCGNGLDIRFWVDWWVGDGPLMGIYPALFALENQKSVSVADRIASWDWRRPPISVQELAELHGCNSLIASTNLLNTSDRWSWPSDQDGTFSVSQCRKLLGNHAVPFYPFSWFKWVPRKVSVFAWRMEQDRLSTYIGLKARRILNGSPLCRICGEGDEDANHLFISCYAATVLWQQVSSWCRIPQIYAHSIRDLLDIHNHSGSSAVKRDVIKMIVLAGTWTIWKMRNEVIFQGKRVNIQGLFGEVQAITFSWLKYRVKKEWSWEMWREFDIPTT
ncbi:reverse transcriptase domain, Reverse transcriptase zinc-binding domain protein [Artemisia annua]|uniref:Reverse transcriptase domain, Reverse transcriptase zinc-binding domain protein n=1 Tax=Artemisia annua TaxID=35608 RepID=A0A2U1MPM6_ARTAN|nr:reverse transcriptase domain, Reverse transcriptase zinc-binding domain protein [Artemisia annua]